jgi:beta-D-galactosyl-(1->4)-L-rhamnose phosphorylase
MAHVLGVDLDRGKYDCHGRWAFEVVDENRLIPADIGFQERGDIVLTNGEATVLAKAGESPVVTLHAFGKGKGVYMADFAHDHAFTRLLQNLLLYSVNGPTIPEGVCDNPYTECAVYPGAKQIAFVNNHGGTQTTACHWKGHRYETTLEPYAMRLLPLR